MHYFEEKAIPRHPIPLPKSKEGVTEDISDDEEEVVPTVAGATTEADDSADKDIDDMPIAV